LIYGIYHQPNKESDVIAEMYQSREVQRMAKVSRIQLIHWTETGAIIPAQDAQGRGGRRIYSHSNLIETIICRELNRYSIPVQYIKHIMDLFREQRYLEKLKDVWDEIKRDPTQAFFLVVTRMLNAPEKSFLVGMKEASVIQKHLTTFVPRHGSTSILVNLWSIIKEAGGV
jgi:DNA-binding transcriptional MerR regulator